MVEHALVCFLPFPPNFSFITSRFYPYFSYHPPPISAILCCVLKADFVAFAPVLSHWQPLKMILLPLCHPQEAVGRQSDRQNWLIMAG